MSLKSLSTLVECGKGYEIVLPNLKGTVYAQGTRGLIAKSPFTEGIGFVPLANLGRLNTYYSSVKQNDWGYPDISSDIDFDRSPGYVSIKASSTGHTIYVPFSGDGGGNANGTITNDDFRIFVFDKDTGDTLTDGTIHTASNLDWSGSGKQTQIEMSIWEPLTDFFVVYIKDESSGGNKTHRFHGFNYNSSTHALSTFTSTQVLSGQDTATEVNVPPMMSINNAGTELMVTQPMSGDYMRIYTYAITGSAGSYSLTSSGTNRRNISFESMSNMHCKPGVNSNVHRLTNDDVIFFGPLVDNSTDTSIAYTSATEYYISIFNATGWTATQQYYLLGETPSTADSSKFANHVCLRSFEIADNTFVLLTKCFSRVNSATGPLGYWTGRDGYSHIRAIKVTIDPSDNSAVQVDLGEFTSDMLGGFMFDNDFSSASYDYGSEVYDWYLDIANTKIIAFTLNEQAVFKFTASFAATDMANSFSTKAPFGPRAIDSDRHAFDESAWQPSEYQPKHSFPRVVENSFYYDHDQKQMICPYTLVEEYVGSDNVNITSCMLTFDVEQLAAYGSVELIVKSADANEVTCWANVEVVRSDGHGFDIGFMQDGWTAVTADYLIRGPLDGNLMDVLVEDVQTHQSTATTDLDTTSGSWVGPLRGPILGESLYEFQKKDLEFAYDPSYESSSSYRTDDHMVFQIEQADQVDSTQEDNYPGPFFRVDNLEHKLLYAYGHYLITGTHYMCHLVTSEGWWCIGNSREMVGCQSTYGFAWTAVLKPSSRIEHNGRFYYGKVGFTIIDDGLRLPWS